MTETLSVETMELLARAAQSGGGRHAFRVKDETIRERAKALADSARVARKSAARKQRRLDIAADMAALRAFNGYDASLVCARADHTADCCRFGALRSVWSDAPKYRDVKRMARHLLTAAEIDRAILPVNWRSIVKRYVLAREASADLGSFSISRDDMRADTRSRFFKRAAYLLSLQDGVNVAASPEDVFQDGIVSSLESGDGLAFGSMFRHVKSSAVSAPYRYRRMGNRHSDNVRDWTWQDWQDWAAANDGSDRLAYSTDAEWQAFDAARDAHSAADAHRRFVAERRLSEASTLDESRAAWVALISQGFTVAKVCRMLGRNPETILTELYSDDRASRLV